METVYTIAGNATDGFVVYNLRGEVCGAGDTFGECVDSIQQRIRSGWLTPGPIWRQLSASCWDVPP